MANKYHIGDNGPGLCEAFKRPCPVGGEHFSSLETAEVVFNEKMEREHGLTSTTSKLEQKNIEEPEANEAWHVNHTGEFYRVYTHEEEDRMKNSLKDAYNSIETLALGKNGDKALRTLQEGLNPSTGRYGMTKSVDDFPKLIASSKRLISDANPHAIEKLNEALKEINNVTGKPATPRKNEKVTFKNEAGRDEEVTFLKTFKKEVNGTKRTRALIIDESGFEKDIAFGRIKYASLGSSK